MSEETVNVRHAVTVVPEFVQWVVQRYGPQPEEWTKTEYEDLVHEYVVQGMKERGMSE